MALADFRNSIITQDKFSATFNKFDQAVSKSARGADTAARALGGGGLMALAGGAAGVFAVSQIARGAWELAELGAASITTRASFESLMSSIGQSPALLDRLSAAAGGTIGEMTLMQQANTALAGTTGQLASEMAAALPKLLEAGRAAAKLNPAYGDAAFMFQSLVGGVKRGTPLLIDNTGIVIKIGQATEDYAASIGKTVDELTSQERSLAILRATLAGADTLIAQAGGSSRSMAEDMAAAEVAAKGLKTALGELLAPPMAAGATKLAGAINEIKGVLTSTELTRSAAMLAGYRIELERLNNIPVGQRTTLDITDIEDTERAIARLTGEMLKDKAAAMAAASAANIFNNQLQILASTENQISDRSRGISREFLQIANSAAIASVRTRQLRDSLSEVRFASQALSGGGLANDPDRKAAWGIATSATAAPLNESLALLSDYNRKLNELNANRANMTKFEYDREKAALLSNLQDSLGAYEKYAKDVGKTMSDMEADIKGKIGSALTPTFDLSGLTGGVLGGMGGDTFDEAYKRLAAVALRPQEELTKHAGDWASTFEQAGLTGLTPEEAQARAKELVEAYSKGLDFSLIDREAIKNSVRQAIKAEELYNSIVDEIYAEMGKPNPKAGQAGYALGKQIGGATAQALKDMAPDAVSAMANAIAPSVARIIRQDASRFGGIPQ